MSLECVDIQRSRRKANPISIANRLAVKKSWAFHQAHCWNVLSLFLSPDNIFPVFVTKFERNPPPLFCLRKRTQMFRCSCQMILTGRNTSAKIVHVNFHLSDVFSVWVQDFFMSLSVKRTQKCQFLVLCREWLSQRSRQFIGHGAEPVSQLLHRFFSGKCNDQNQEHANNQQI